MSTATPSLVENPARQGEKRKRDEPPQQAPPQQYQGINSSVTRERIVEILSNTANGCLSELGYNPGIWARVKELEQQNKKWQEENVKLYQDNRRLVKIVQQNQAVVNNIAIGDRERINRITNLELENHQLKEEKTQMTLLHIDLSKKYDSLVQNYSLAYNQVQHLTAEIHALKIQNQQNATAQRMSPGMSMVPSGQVRQDNQGRRTSSPIIISPSHTPVSASGQGLSSMPIRSNPRASISNPPSRRSSLNIVSPSTLPDSYGQQLSSFPSVVNANSGQAPRPVLYAQQNGPSNPEQHFGNGFPQNLPRRVTHTGAFHPYAGHQPSQSVPTTLQSKVVSRPTSRTNSTPLPTLTTTMNQPPTGNAQQAPLSASAILAARPSFFAPPSPLSSPRGTEVFGLPSPTQLDQTNQAGTIAPNDTYIQAPPPMQPQPTLLAPQPSKPIFSPQHPMFYPTDQNLNAQPPVSSQHVNIPTSLLANQVLLQNQQQLVPQSDIDQDLSQLLQSHAPVPSVPSDSMVVQANTVDNIQPKIEPDLMSGNIFTTDTQISDPPVVEQQAQHMADDDDDDDDEMVELGPDGLLLPKDCFPAIFEDMGDRKLICKLCAHRYEQGIQEQPTEPFLDCTDEQLEKHCVDEHNDAWMMLRKGVDE